MSRYSCNKTTLHHHWYYSGGIVAPYYSDRPSYTDDLVTLDWCVPDQHSSAGYKVHPTTWSKSELVLATDEEIVLRLLLLLSRKR
jgi:hypothetical protein